LRLFPTPRIKYVEQPKVLIVLASFDTLDWQRAYSAVLRETDASALFERVEIAEAAILTRRDALADHSEHHAERNAITEALSVLGNIKRDRLRFDCSST
jgi:hypothetical protein